MWKVYDSAWPPGTQTAEISEESAQYLLSITPTPALLEALWEIAARGGVEEVGEPEPTGEEPEALLGRIVAVLGACDAFPVGEDIPDTLRQTNRVLERLRSEVRDLRARLASIQALAHEIGFAAEIDSDRDNVYIREED